MFTMHKFQRKHQKIYYNYKLIENSIIFLKNQIYKIYYIMQFNLTSFFFSLAILVIVIRKLEIIVTSFDSDF